LLQSGVNLIIEKVEPGLSLRPLSTSLLLSCTDPLLSFRFLSLNSSHTLPSITGHRSLILYPSHHSVSLTSVRGVSRNSVSCLSGVCSEVLAADDTDLFSAKISVSVSLPVIELCSLVVTVQRVIEKNEGGCDKTCVLYSPHFVRFSREHNN
jgi:hypothetical protein